MKTTITVLCEKGYPVPFRRRYYDGFSRFYDAFVRLHSRDKGESMRDSLAQAARLDEGAVVVDLCTGTGSSALRMAGAARVRVVGIDFSLGMLRQAHRKTPDRNRCLWIQADARHLPITSGSVDRVTCAYAMYELSAEARVQALREAGRVLKAGGMFLMMEHVAPRRPLTKALYFVRIYLLGTRGVRSFAGSEESHLRRLFERVASTTAPGGRTRVVYGFKPE